MSGDFATLASPEVVTSHVFPAQTLITQNNNIQRQSSHYRGENSGYNTQHSDQTPDIDSSYLMKILGNNSQWVEASDKTGERSGYYTYLSPEGDTVLVRYSAGVDGFRVLESRGVPGLTIW